MITFTRKKQPPQVMLDCKSHTQVTFGPPAYSTGLHTSVRAKDVTRFCNCLYCRCRRAGWPYQLSSTTEVAARMPIAVLAPPARQKHTRPDQLLQLSKLPVAGSSQHLMSNKKQLVSQQDITALPLPPVIVPSKLVTKVITPLTHPEDRSSDSDSSWSKARSCGASSYQPSSSSAGREEAVDHINARAGQPAAAKQARELTKVMNRCAGKPVAYQTKSTALQLPAATSEGTAEMVQVCLSLSNSISNSLVVDYEVGEMPQSFWCNAPSLQYILQNFAVLLACSLLFHSCIVAGQTRSR